MFLSGIFGLNHVYFQIDLTINEKQSDRKSGGKIRLKISRGCFLFMIHRKHSCVHVDVLGKMFSSRPRVRLQAICV